MKIKEFMEILDGNHYAILLDADSFEEIAEIDKSSDYGKYKECDILEITVRNYDAVGLVINDIK